MRGESLSRPTPRRVGIRDVAAYAGVAISTVSKVLSGQGEVSETLRERVRAAADELGYQPNFLAQSLRRGATNSVGFVASDLAEPFYAGLAAGAEPVMRDAGYAFLVMSSHGDPGGDAANVEFLQSRLVDAIIIAPSTEQHAPTIAALARFDGPVAVIEGVTTASVDADLICENHRSGARAAALHLMGLGHQRIALVTGPLERRANRERMAGLNEATVGHANGQGDLTMAGDDNPTAGELATCALLDGLNPPTAILVGSEPLLDGVLRELDRRQLAVGRDISVVSWGDTSLTQRFHPPIAVVDHEPRSLGQAAAVAVLERLSHARPATELSRETQFVVRDSCAVPAIARVVSEAHVS